MARSLTSEDQRDIRDTAHKLADAARSAILPHFRTAGLNTTSKDAEGFDPVTVADRAGEIAMREILAQARPDDGILGEELATVDGTSGLTWVLDPIDGTRGFISGTPTWGVLIGARYHDEVVYGVVDQPYIGERFFGGFGEAACEGPLGRSDLGVSSKTQLETATIFTTFPEVGTREEGAAFHRVAEKCQLTRYGCDCYAYALLAAGHVDLVIEAGLHAYDIVGPAGVIEAAGGVITSWEGGSILDGGRSVAAATPELHEAALKLLQSG